MTRTTNARLAGSAFLVYIAAGILASVLTGRATAGAEGTAARLAAIAQHASYVQFAFVLNLFTCFLALVLAVTLYSLTRDQDSDLALLGFTCRVTEGVLGAIFITGGLGRLWLASAMSTSTLDAASVATLAPFFSKAGSWNAGATFFAVGSVLFTWLLLRAKTIPAALGWLGIVASVVLVIGLPLQLVGLSGGIASQLMWLPMLAFEVPVGLWLLIKKKI